MLEPGEDERFVSEEELEERLGSLLNNWPRELPDDLARFGTINEAVAYLVTSACELDLGPGEGQIQWYQVRLEA